MLDKKWFKIVEHPIFFKQLLCFNKSSPLPPPKKKQ